MKARESDIKIKRWVAMLQAADLIEMEGRYEFEKTEKPESCSDVGCVLGWVAYAAGIPQEPFKNNGYPLHVLDAAAQFMGYEDDHYFYLDMHRVCGNALWYDDPEVAATTLRKLAEEMAT